MRLYTTHEVARILEVEEARVRSLARLGAIAPRSASGKLEFTFQDLVLLKTTKGLVEAGVPSHRLRRVWSSLRRQVDSDRPLTGITIYADGDRAVASDGRARWQPDSGQFLLPFGAGDIPEPVAVAALVDPAEDAALEARAEAPTVRGPARAPRSIAVARRSRPLASIHPMRPRETVPTSDLTAEQWFQLAGELESTSPRESRDAYRRAIALDPDFSDAHLDLGRHHHEAGEYDEAEEHYREAIRCCPKDATCWFNLGVLLEDRGRGAEAAHAYDRAVTFDSELADAHYNLGLLHETLGNRGRAVKHLMVARQLYAKSGGGKSQ